MWLYSRSKLLPQLTQVPVKVEDCLPKFLAKAGALGWATTTPD
jgi:hypothetical protein